MKIQNYPAADDLAVGTKLLFGSAVIIAFYKRTQIPF